MAAYYDTTKPTVGIIGAGFSGICAAIRLKQELGIEAQILEESKDVGGTWHFNRYPGCACDVPSHLYSLSFEPNPDWSQHYSPSEEIHDYIKNITKKHNLYDNISFNTHVDKATWLQDECRWKVDVHSTTDGAACTYYFDCMYLSVGTIRVPRTPKEFTGFQGPIVHTADWDSSVDFTNKRVAVVGSGASAVQAVPRLQKQAAHLVSYQRSPAWVRVRQQYHYSKLKKFLFRWIPLLLLLHRWYIYWAGELGYVVFGYYKSFLARWYSNSVAKSMRQRIEGQGRPDLVEKLIPKYLMGCKRIAPSEDYLEALCQDNVTVETTSIQKVEGRTITTVDGKEQEFDILVLATGFDVPGFLANLEVQGTHKETLNEMWKDKFPGTYKTVLVNGFPNLFVILGPSSILGHNSVLVMVECQVNYTIKCLKRMIKEKVAAIEPTQEAQDKFVQEIKKDLETTVWKRGGCNSWYINSAGEASALWSSTVTRFWWMLRSVKNLKDFNTYKAV
ncbi:monooxygenase [Lichtheimia corymbifera JMRC:FSU:9682]|uniref:Monooxygenase n=1 Tax=Lichtheimia corymbifera JMRC:FSU:9682 TaxID=1263082 RepID=A0A068RUF3_9FUNG|nr:monooxygenase [Lichtheimia corymbifera JMRC:FSU:9682]